MTVTQWIIAIVTILVSAPILAAGVSAARETKRIPFDRPEWGAQALFAAALLFFGFLLFASGTVLWGFAS